MKRMSADEAAEIIQHDQMVAFSGFTPAGSPKALPAAIARRAGELHQAQQPFQIRLLTGASISAAADDALSAADAVSWRAPYQTASGLRQKINQGKVNFVDLHLSEVAQMVNYGFFGEIDVAVIEASALAPDGRVWLTSGRNSGGMRPRAISSSRKVTTLSAICWHTGLILSSALPASGSSFSTTATIFCGSICTYRLPTRSMV